MLDVSAVRRTERVFAIREHLRREAAFFKDSDVKAFRVFAEIYLYISYFDPKVPYWRRPILLIIGATNLGKSMLAADVIKRVGKILGLTRY